MPKPLLWTIGFLLALCSVSGQTIESEIVRNLELAKTAMAESNPDSMAIYMKKARAASLQKEDLTDYISTSLAIAQALFRTPNAESGLRLLQQVQMDIRQTTQAGTPEEMEICYQVARGFYFLGRYDSCRIQASENLAHFRTPSSTETALDRANHYNLIGASYNASGQPAKALEAFHMVLELRLAALGKLDNRVASIYYNLGNAYTNLRLYNKALEAYTNGIDISEQLLGSDDPSLGRMFLNMGALYDDMGAYDNAIKTYYRALALYEKEPETFADQIADLYKNLAIAFKNKGAFEQSGAYQQRALQRYEQLPGNQSANIADVYTNIALLAGIKKKLAEAVQWHERALQLYEQNLPPADPRRIAAHNNLGIAYAESGDFEGALAQLFGIVPLLNAHDELQPQLANLQTDIADVYFKLGDLAQAKAHNLKALAIQEKVFPAKSYRLAITCNSLAEIALLTQLPDTALHYIQRALAANHVHYTAEETQGIPSPGGYLRYEPFVKSLMLKAALLSRNNEQDNSMLLQIHLLYRAADSVLTAVQNELLSSEDKLRLSEQIYNLSQRAIENSLLLSDATSDPRYLEDAFRYAEKNKNTVLAQSITANHAKQFAGIPDRLTALEHQLQANIRYYKLRFTEQPDSSAAARYQEELFNAEIAYQELIPQLETAYPLYYQLKYDQTVPRVSALQFALPDQTAMMSYFAGDSALYSFVITKDEFSVHRASIDDDFYQQQVGLRKSINWQLDEDYVALAYTLYQKLFPIALNPRIKSLIIVPDGTLSKLPFETLLTRKINPRRGFQASKLPYLIQDYDICYALSGALYYQQRVATANPQIAGEGLMAYAPVFSEQQNVVSFDNGVFNPLRNAKAGGVGRAITLNGAYVTALPATAEEVQSIARVFRQNGEPVVTYLFREANENKLKQSNTQRSRYIHIATHGFINEEQPDLSGLLMFPDSVGQEDHILYSGEVYGLNLSADLVVLSACETGLGKVANGEGLLGLSRAFRYAGAENLIVSLWKVQDRATADLMVRFYTEHLTKQTNRFATPLRQAKLDMIRSETFSHPYFWSAFVLIGE